MVRYQHLDVVIQRQHHKNVKAHPWLGVILHDSDGALVSSYYDSKGEGTFEAKKERENYLHFALVISKP